MATDFTFCELDERYAEDIVQLALLLNPDKTAEALRPCMREMFAMNTYHCFGAFDGDRLAAISSGWLTSRFYSGRQLEVDNVVVAEAYRSSGLGRALLNYIEDWALARGCQTVELNTYVQNGRSHKFYFNAGYFVLGFHFQKKLR